MLPRETKTITSLVCKIFNTMGPSTLFLFKKVKADRRALSVTWSHPRIYCSEALAHVVNLLFCHIWQLQCIAQTNHNKLTFFLKWRNNRDSWNIERIAADLIWKYCNNSKTWLEFYGVFVFIDIIYIPRFKPISIFDFWLKLNSKARTFHSLTSHQQKLAQMSKPLMLPFPAVAWMFLMCLKK